MGTPVFAVESLKTLVQTGENVVAVITTPDKPAGRGQKIQQSPVKQYALDQGIPILQPEKLKDNEFLNELQSYQADLQVVVAFRMLPKIVWDMPPMGTINVHASLLPQYRGAAPINHALMNGEKETGVTTFLLQHEIDTGHILLSETVNIEETDNAGALHDKLMIAGTRVLRRTIDGLKEKTLHPIPQADLPTEILRHAPKIFKEDCLIDWSQDTETIHNKIRGLSPYPTAFTKIDGKILKIFEAKKEIAPPLIAAGTYQTDGKTYLKFATKDGYVSLTTIQMEGKKKMDITEFLKGYRFD